MRVSLVLFFFFKDAVELLPVLLAPEGTVLDTYHAGGLGK